MAPSILVDAVKDNVGTSTPTSAKKVSGDMVWRPGMYADSTAYTYHLQPGEIKELETALHMFKCTFLEPSAAHMITEHTKHMNSMDTKSTGRTLTSRR